ncbi:MAG: hypothetical protein F4024_18720 [Gammaproteobacteria bacterium]|nr:hypothetical protein [Gammaproteobacteria bacterium]
MASRSTTSAASACRRRKTNWRRSATRWRIFSPIIVDEPDRVRQLLTDYLRQHPGDAAYHDVAVSKNGDLSDHDLDRAVSQAVVMEARPA